MIIISLSGNFPLSFTSLADKKGAFAETRFTGK
jgi:hypothetical protein